MINHFFGLLTRNLLSLFGTSLALVALLLIISLIVIQALGFQGGTYLGILTFLILPMVMVLGLLLIPVGYWWQKRRERRATEAHVTPPRFPIIDLNQEKTRGVVLIFLLVTVFNVVIIAGATYKGVQIMDSTEFCGTACHIVMQPEYTAHQRSPHARVSCADCHIGAGADWFVKSKLSGAWQLVAVALDLYPRPIPSPVENLRPARETCEECHWPTRFSGDRLKVRVHYEEDEANTELTSVLLVKVGGIHGRESSGIHWHVDPRNEIRFLADRKRENIYDVELTTPEGKKVFKVAEEAPADAAWRTMDCVDCHNRPTHIYRSAEDEVDLAIETGRIAQSLPFIKREGVRALKVEYDSHAAARTGIAADIAQYYASNYPEVATAQADDIDAASAALGDIFSWNVFPHMKVTWGTYPDHIGHEDGPGCFRCHNRQHKTEDGEGISRRCATCHTILAEGEQNPEILTTLNP